MNIHDHLRAVEGALNPIHRLCEPKLYRLTFVAAHIGATAAAGVAGGIIVARLDERFRRVHAPALRPIVHASQIIVGRAAANVAQPVANSIVAGAVVSQRKGAAHLWVRKVLIVRDDVVRIRRHCAVPHSHEVGRAPRTIHIRRAVAVEAALRPAAAGVHARVLKETAPLPAHVGCALRLGEVNSVVAAVLQRGECHLRQCHHAV